MITLAQIVMDVANNESFCYNGHSSFVITHLSLGDAIQLCKDLEELDENHNSYTIELWTDGSLTIYCQDYWRSGEHPLGHTAKLILSVDKP